MKLPNAKIELALAETGSTAIGVDEAGRGPLAGPVVAAAAWVNPDILEKEFEERALIRDSKTLSEKQREQIHDHISNSEKFEAGIGEVSHQMIDRLNILNATLLAMRLACEELIEKMALKKIIQKNEEVCVLIDGNKKIPKISHEQRMFAKGDLNIFSIATASIFAKVYRDSIMKGYHKEYPAYGFDRHKGYGTRYHFQQIQKNGPCDIHRKSFGPIKSY